MPDNQHIIISNVRELQKLRSLSQPETLAQGVLDTIAAGALAVNDALPSVNTLMSELGYARETVNKGYKLLKEQGVVASKHRKGYFVVSTAGSWKQRIALIMYAYDAFQEQLYQSFMATISDGAVVDLFFHHNNPDVFEAVFNRINGSYSLYIVAPIINKKSNDLLAKLPPSKLLIIDRYVNLGSEYSYIVQEFEASSYWVFEQLATQFQKYKELVFYFRQNTAEPGEIYRSFKRFVLNYQIKARVEEKFMPGTLSANKAYFSIHNPELYAILKEAQQKGFEPGKDIGVLAHNDDVVKEIVGGGITTFSVDFAEIGRLAAQFALHRHKIQLTLPTLLRQRKSL